MRKIGTMLTALACTGAWAGGACGQSCEPSWSEEFAAGPNDTVYAAFPSDEALYIGGRFTSAGGVAALRVAAFADGGWSALGEGVWISEICWVPNAQVRALLETGLPGAAGLVAGGGMSPVRNAPLIGLWDGAGWHAMDGGLAVDLFDVCGEVRDLVIFDDGAGPALYASGYFSDPAVGIARWSGTTWEGVDGGLGGLSLTGGGYAMATHDDGTGPGLYVGGRFTSGGSVPARNIARWFPGVGWSALGEGLTFEAQSLLSFEDGGERVLLAAGGDSASGEVWRWDGADWARMGGAFDGRVNALAIFDDGSGPTAYAGGEFNSSAGQSIRGLARWDGADWVEAAGGVAGAVHALEPALHEGVLTLIVGGSFATVGDGASGGSVPSQNLARLIGCATPGCYADCDGDGSLTFFDFLCFQNLFTAGDPLADCDESGELDFFDFLCFQNAFAAGCE